MSTFNAPPDQINYDINDHLVLINGDTLNLSQGGTVSGITFLPGSNLNMKGGTATDIILEHGVFASVSGTLVDTTLAGGSLSVLDGTVNGITFEGSPSSNPNVSIDELIATPDSIQGTLTFASVDVGGSYQVEIVLPDITSIDTTVVGTLTVNFANHQSVAYHYIPEGGPLKFTLMPFGGAIEVQLQQFGSPFSPETAGTIVYTAEFGSAPSASELTILNQFTQAQFDFGQKIGVMDPSIYAFQALGVALASTATNFQNTFGPAVDGDVQFVVDAYASVFGHPGSGAQIQQFADQLDSFETLYTAAGTFGSASNIDLLARGAIYGQMLAIEHESGLGTPPPGPVFDLTQGQDTIALDQSGSAVTGTFGAADATWTPGDTITAAPGTTDQSFDIQGIGGAGVIDVTSVPGNHVSGVQNANISANTAASGFSDQAVHGDFTATGPEGAWSGLAQLVVDSAGNEAGADNLTVGPDTAVQITDTLTAATSEALTVNGSSTTTITENNLAANAGITVNGGSGTTAVSITQTETTVGDDGIVNIIDVNGASKTEAGSITKILLDGLSHSNTIIDNALTSLTVNNSDTSGAGLTINNDLITPTATTLNLSLSHDGVNAAGTGAAALEITDINNEYSTVHLSLGAENSFLTLNDNGLITLDTANSGTGALVVGIGIAASTINDNVDAAVNFDFSGLNGPNEIQVNRGTTNNLDVFTLSNFGTDLGNDNGASQTFTVTDDLPNYIDTINFGSGAYLINDTDHPDVSHSYVQTAANGIAIGNFQFQQQWAAFGTVHGGQNSDTLTFKTDNVETFVNLGVQTSFAVGLANALSSTQAHTAVAFKTSNDGTWIFDHADNSSVLTAADSMIQLVGTYSIAGVSATHEITFV